MAACVGHEEIRKLKKKLRQIECLERLERDLTQEEREKVSKKTEVAKLLSEKISESQKGNPYGMALKISEAEKVPDCGQVNEKTPAKNEVNRQNLSNVLQTKPERRGCETTTPEMNEKHEKAKQVGKTERDSSIGQFFQKAKSQGEKPVNEINEKTETNKKKLKNEWKDRKFTVRCLEGHHAPITSIDLDGSTLVSASCDSTIKVWDADSGEEVSTLRGHTGAVSSVVLVKTEKSQESNTEYICVSGSQDCSIRYWSVVNGKSVRSVYAYSPISCLDQRKELLCSGSEGGKVEIWDLETGSNIASTTYTDDDGSVTRIKFQGDSVVVSGSSTGQIKVWDVRQTSLLPVTFARDPNMTFVKRDRVRCLATTDANIYWGDNNIKVLDLKAGKVRKLKNRLSIYGVTTELLVHDSLLFSAGHDGATAQTHINVRTLANEEYLGTIGDEMTTRISGLRCVDTHNEDSLRYRICTGGDKLMIYDHVNGNKLRKTARYVQDPSFITSQQINGYANSEDIIDTDSAEDSDSNDESQYSSSDEDNDQQTKATLTKESWCTMS